MLEVLFFFLTGTAGAEGPLSALETVSGGYPYYFRFQETAWFAERLKFECSRGDRSEEDSYILWRDAFKPYQGLLTSRFERNPDESFIRNFTDRFKQDFPNKMVIWQTSGHSWYYYNEGSQFEYYHPAHFLYSAGSVTTGAVNLTDTALHFSVLPADVPVATNYNTYVILIDRDAQGKLNWTRTEQARVISKTNTVLEVERGVFTGYPALDFTNGVYVAAHTDLNGSWLFNFSTEAPTDPVRGLKGWQARAEHLASLFKKESSSGSGDQGILWRTDGIEFDAMGDLNRSQWRDADCNMDGTADQGLLIIGGVTRDTYMEGIVRKLEILNVHLSNTNYVNTPKFVLSDPLQYGHRYLNGTEKEAQGTDLDYSVLNQIAFYNQYAGNEPKFNYFNQKFVDWKTKQNKYRLNMGMASIYDAKWTVAQAADRYGFASMYDAPDEATKGTEMVNGWLGRPVAPALNLGLSGGADLLAGIFNPVTISSLPNVCSTGGRLSIETNRLTFVPAVTNSMDGTAAFYILRVPVSSACRLHGRIDLQASMPPELADLTRFGTVSLQSFIELVPSVYQWKTDPVSAQKPAYWYATAETINGTPVPGWNIWNYQNSSTMYEGSVFNVPSGQRLLLYFKGYTTDTYTFSDTQLKVYANGNTNNPVFSTTIPAADVNVMKTFEIGLDSFASQNVNLRVEVSRGATGGVRNYCWLSLGRLVFSDMLPGFIHRKTVTKDDDVTGEPVVSYEEESTKIYAGSSGVFSNGFFFAQIDPAVSMVHIKVDLDLAWRYDMERVIASDESAVFAREFENGYILVNNNGASGPGVSFDLKTLFGVTKAKKLQSRTDRSAIWIQDDTLTNDGTLIGPIVTVPSDDGLFLIRTQSAALPDTDGDGLPDIWESQHFGGVTNADPGALAANGLDTVYEAYIAGLNPTNAQSRFTVSSRAQDILQWNGVSGRVYSVYWSTNLLNGFQPLATNIIWPQTVLTNFANQGNGSGFYRINVRLNE